MSQINTTVRDFIRENQEIIGFEPEDQCAVDMVNKARVIAYPMGDWVGTVGYFAAPMHCGNFFLPSCYESIRQVRQCNNQGRVQLDIDSVEYNMCGGLIIMARLYGRSYCPVMLNGCPLTFTVCNKQDENKLIRVQYVDNKGSMRDENVKMAYPYSPATFGASSLTYIPGEIKRITKPVTVGMVRVNSGTAEGYIESWDRNPTYSIYTSTGTNCNCDGPVYVKAKKKCIPYTTDNLDDVLDINPEALSSLVFAVKAKSRQQQDWLQNYQSLVRLAKEFLNAELQNETDTSVGMASVRMDDKFFNSLNDGFETVYE